MKYETNLLSGYEIRIEINIHRQMLYDNLYRTIIHNHSL